MNDRRSPWRLYAHLCESSHLLLPNFVPTIRKYSFQRGGGQRKPEEYTRFTLTVADELNHALPQIYSECGEESATLRKNGAIERARCLSNEHRADVFRFFKETYQATIIFIDVLRLCIR